MGKKSNTHKHEIKIIFHFFLIQIESENRNSNKITRIIIKPIQLKEIFQTFEV